MIYTDVNTISYYIARILYLSILHIAQHHLLT